MPKNNIRPRFDAKKVARIKKLIKAGKYDFSAERVADSIIAGCHPDLIKRIANKISGK